MRTRWVVQMALGAAVGAASLLAGWAAPTAAAPAGAAAGCAPAGYRTAGPPASSLLAVAAAGPADVWAGGRGYGNPSTMLWHWGGSEWAPAGPTIADGYIRGLGVLSPTDIWAVGGTANVNGDAGDMPLALHWNGAQWTATVVPTLPPYPYSSAHLTAVAGAAPNDVWAVGQAIVHWDGHGWQTAPLDLPAGAWLDLHSVVAPRANDVWAAGSFGTGAPGPNGDQLHTPLLLHWDGATWRRVESQLPAGFVAEALAALPGQAGVWAVGTGAAHWDGTRWTRLAVPTGPDLTLTAVTVTTDGTAWATAAESGIFAHSRILHWDGRAWGLVASPGPDSVYVNLASIAVEGPDDVWTVGAHAYSDPHTSGSDAYTFHIFRRCTVPAAPVANPRAPDVVYFPQTQHTLRGIFRTYWEQHGGLAQFGYPITEEYPEKSTTDGQIYTVQYFQRNRFEAHPENAGTPYEVLLGLLGRTISTIAAPAQPFYFQPVTDPPPGVRYFPQTQHTLAPEFAAYWDTHGGLAVYGYPISEPFRETNQTDRQEYLVQYFERNRLEYPPELPAAFQVSLGLLGAEVLQARGWLP